MVAVFEPKYYILIFRIESSKMVQWQVIYGTSLVYWESTDYNETKSEVQSNKKDVYLNDDNLADNKENII